MTTQKRTAMTNWYYAIDKQQVGPISEEELKAQLETPTVAPEEVEVVKKEKAEEEVSAVEETTPAAKTEEKKVEEKK